MQKPKYAAPRGSTFQSWSKFYQESVYSEFEQEHRSGGGLGVQIIKARQPALDLIDAKTPDYVFTVAHTSAKQVVIDLGDGAKQHQNAAAMTVNVIPPGAEARYFVSCPHRICMVAVPRQRLLPVLRDAGFGLHAFSRYYAGDDAYRPHPRIFQLINEMWRTANEDAVSTGLYLDGLALQLIALAADEGSAAATAQYRRESQRIERAMEFIETHIGEALTVAQLADEACFSVGHFARCFKSETGETVWAFVQRRRCERAKEMLLTTQSSLSEIAYACGFAHQGHFTQCFRKQFGVTPGQVRKDHSAMPDGYRGSCQSD